MENTNQKKRIVALVDSNIIKDQLSKSLNGQEELDYELVHMDDSIDVSAVIVASDPDIVLVEHAKGTEKGLEVIDDLSLHFANIPVLAILQEEDSSMVQRALLAGARAFILLPFTRINLLTMVRRVLELQERNTSARSPQATSSIVSALTLSTFAVFSPRGGVGCSTIATNLALSLMEQSSKNVLLFDGKQYFGHADVMLNLRTRNSIADLIPHSNNLDEGLIKDVVLQHISGLNVLLSAPSLQVAQGIRPEDIYNIIVGMQGVYDYIVVDGGNSLSEVAVTMLDSAYRILLVLKPDLASLRDARQFLEISHSLGYPNEKILLVLNEATSKGGVKGGDIESALKRKLFASIPQDTANAQRSLNRGIPLNIRYPNSPISKSINSMANSLIELVDRELASPHVGKGTDQAKQEALKKSSLFG
jgi:pilus assembly protein CpaE